MANLHHTQLCARLQRHLDDLGGPTSLAAYLVMAAPTIDPLLANGVQWAWLAARIDAVRNAAGETIAPDLPDAQLSRVHVMRTTYSRIKRRRCRPTQPQMPGQTTAAPPIPALPTEGGHDPPRLAGARNRIHLSARQFASLGNLEKE